MENFSVTVLFCSIPVILICHDDLSESTYLLLTVSCIAVFIIAVHAFPFRVASMSAVRYDLSEGLPIIYVLGTFLYIHESCVNLIWYLYLFFIE